MDPISSIENFFNALGSDWVNFYNSGFFAVIKFLLGIYALVLLLDIIFLLIKRGVMGNLRELRYGMNMPPELASKKNITRDRWDKIKKRLDGENPAEYKVAIIEADEMIDNLVKQLGYPGENLGERLANIPAGQIENVESMRESHEFKNKVVLDENFDVSKEVAQNILDTYEAFLRSFEVFD